MAGKAMGLESPVLLSVSGRTRLCQLLLVRCWDQQSRRHYSRGSQPCYWRLPSYRVWPQPCSNTSGPIKVFMITWKTTCMSAVSNWSKQESSSPGAVLAIPVLENISGAIPTCLPNQTHLIPKAEMGLSDREDMQNMHCWDGFKKLVGNRCIRRCISFHHVPF